MSNPKIDNKHTQEIVCPYCGTEFIDSWEHEEYHNPIICEECDNEFTFERIVDVAYCTYKKK